MAANVNNVKIFVGRLPEGCASKDLEDLFSTYGKVCECDVVGKYGFVHMSNPEEANEAIRKLDKYYFMGSQLSVEHSTSKASRPQGNKMRSSFPNRRPRQTPYDPQMQPRNVPPFRPPFDQTRFYEPRYERFPPASPHLANHPFLRPNSHEFDQRHSDPIYSSRAPSFPPREPLPRNDYWRPEVGFDQPFPPPFRANFGINLRGQGFSPRPFRPFAPRRFR